MTTDVGAKKNCTQQNFRSELDLVFERVVDVPPEVVWAAWTRLEYIKDVAYTGSMCDHRFDIDLRLGGVF